MTDFQDDFSREIWESTYRYHSDNNIDETLYRIAEGAAVAETTDDLKKYWTNRFYTLLSGFKFVPAGRIISNCGTDFTGTTLMNCFSAPRSRDKLDSLSGILLNLNNLAQTLKSEGGWGDNFSYIRPRGSYIEGIGSETPGAVTFMELFNTVSGVITSGSGSTIKNKKGKKKIRKGAMMAVLDVWHPDIMEFIVAKQTPGKLSKFNMSVNCTDKFMAHVENIVDNGADDVEWELIFPDTTFPQYDSEWYGDIDEWIAKNYPIIIHGKTTVMTLWNTIMESTYNRAEPGVLFLDVGNRLEPASYLGRIFTTNPCVAGDTKILTKKGHVEIQTMIDAPVEIWNGHEWSEVQPRITATDEEMIKVELSNGMTGRFTHYHRWATDRGTVETHDLRPGDVLDKWEYPVIEGEKELEDAYQYGFFCGDGWTSGGNFYIGLYGEKKELVEHLAYNSISVKEYNIVGGYVGTDLTQTRLYVNLGRRCKFKKGFVPSAEYTVESRIKWLAGLADSDGYLTKDDSIQISAKSREFLSEVQMMLTTLGCFSHLSVMHDCWRLSIAKRYGTALQDNGLVMYRLGKLNPLKRPFNPVIKIKELKNDGIDAKVYCFNELKRHLGNFNGINTRNCAEQLLQPGGVCDLGSFNLTQYINHLDATFSIDKFTSDIKFAVRFLDNINSISDAPLPEYIDSIRNKRRIGIGILGWGSLLFMMKMPFASERAAQLRDLIMSTLSRTAYESSIELAVEKGCFSYCDIEKHKNGEFITGLNISPYHQELLESTGIRNSSLLSIQPTGNTSIMANIVSGGLEPIFMPEYTRTTIVNAMPDEIKDVCPKWYEGEFFETELFKFTKEGDEIILRGVHNGTTYKIDKNRGLTKEVLCEDYGVRWLKARNEWDADSDWAVTAENLTVNQHLNDMAGFSTFIDSAISKTINVPHDYLYEDFKQIYLDAYKKRTIRGVTTYRAGTMTNVLAATTQESEEIILDDVKLPTDAPSVMKTMRYKNSKWYVTIVYKVENKEPFAIFVQTNKRENSEVAMGCIKTLLKLAADKGIPTSHIDALSKKIKKSSNVQKLARCISLLLRHGVLIKNITMAIDSVPNVYVGSFIYQIKKFLQSYIPDGEITEGKCDSCGGNKLVFSEGCFKCNDCGVSKC